MPKKSNPAPKSQAAADGATLLPGTPLRSLWGHGIALPVALYFAFFALYTFPAISEFSTRFFCDDGDGMQNVWNLWWVNFAVRHGQNPWFTYFLHFPEGTTLVPQTMNIYNGFMMTPFMDVLSPVQAHNVVVTFAFVVGGLTMFWLSWRVTGRYLGSLLAGFIFTFSNYHFAHAQGHLQLVSQEWIPLFFFCWVNFLRKPRGVQAFCAAAALGLVMLCDYYYLLFCVLSGAFLAAWHLLKTRRQGIWRSPEWLIGCGMFIACVLLLCGPMVFALLRLQQQDPLMGAHPAWEYSMDVLAPVIWGGHWRWSSLTQDFWRHLPGNIHESSVHWGLSAIVLGGVAWAYRRRTTTFMVGAWLGLLVFFALLALGPAPRLWGQPLGVPGLYSALVLLIPPLELSGCPARMSVIVFICLGILSGLGFDCLWNQPGGKRVLGIVLALLVVIEYWPQPIPLTDPQYSEFVQEAQHFDPAFGLFNIDRSQSESMLLYEQTGHHLPMVHGYVSRVPLSVARRDAYLDYLAQHGQWQLLCEKYGIRYLVLREMSPFRALLGDMQPAFVRSQRAFYDIGRTWSCTRTPSAI